MLEKWSHRADLAESAINDRHARRVWGIPMTNLAVVSWPSSTRDEFFFHWHYWWQAHYLDCQIDAYARRATQKRKKRIANTMRGIRVRNINPWTVNRYYDDKSWLALALGRYTHASKSKGLRALELNIEQGIDSLTGVLPWRTNETFYNVPTNGPAAIMMARTGRIETARSLTDWMFEQLLDDDGLLMDGLRMRMHGPELVRIVYPYCQGVALGACLEIAERTEPEVAARYVVRVRELIDAISAKLATPTGVIDSKTDGGDGGLFKGILVRYLADVAERLPGDSPSSQAARRSAARLVLRSAESVWNHRLEVDGLPVFAADWTADAQLPKNSAVHRPTIEGTVLGSTVAERDLSVQLSGWMLLEAAARCAAAGFEE
ncbi:glycoside hydrolase family 76 protein [Staphylococcus chromogenes]|nr:glycoside hydrolase family 76 protein [Staphylococcus chromogenes]